MRFWKKIFLYSFILFMIVFNGAGIIIIENIHSRNMDIAIKTSLGEAKDIVNTIHLNSDLFYKYEGNALWKKLKNYLQSDFSDDRKIEVLDKENRVVMETSSSSVGMDKKYLEHMSPNEYKFVISNVDRNEYISVNYIIKIGEEQFKIVVTNNITYLDVDRLNNYKTFLWLSSLATIIMGLGLYLISKNITKPIVELTKVSNNIKKGNYSERADYKRNDEIGILSENFNAMMTVIEENIEELRYTSEARQKFIDNLTHEMKTPITSILGYSELLLKGNLNEELKAKSLMNINLQGKRLENLNSSLVKLILAKKTKVDFETLDINGVIKSLVESTTYRLESKNIKLVKDIKVGRIMGQEDLIEALLTNLVDNAVKASKEGSKIEVVGYPIKDKMKYKLTIKDWGAGISKEDLKHIKEPFYMVDKARNTKGKNMGLGLTLCTEICSLGNIEFDIESELEKGTIVILKFDMESIRDEK